MQLGTHLWLCKYSSLIDWTSVTRTKRSFDLGGHFDVGRHERQSRVPAETRFARHFLELPYLLRWVGLPSILIALVTLPWSYVNTNSWWSGLLSDIGITALGVLFTVFFVESMQQRNEDRRWQGFEAIAEERLRVTTAKFVYWIFQCDPDFERRVRFWTGMEPMRLFPHRFWEDVVYRDGWKVHLRTTVIEEMDSFLPSGENERFDGLKAAYVSYSVQLRDIVQICGPVLQPQQLQGVLTILMWVSQLEAEKRWEGFDANIRWYTTQILNQCVALIETMEPLPSRGSYYESKS